MVANPAIVEIERSIIHLMTRLVNNLIIANLTFLFSKSIPETGTA